jgi:hypothetical protein
VRAGAALLKADRAWPALQALPADATLIVKSDGKDRQTGGT